MSKMLRETGCFCWLWKSHVIKQGPNRRPNLKSTKLLTRDASFPPESKKTQWFSLLFQARLAKKAQWARLAKLTGLTGRTGLSKLTRPP